jgi:hypothetical protein
MQQGDLWVAFFLPERRSYHHPPLPFSPTPPKLLHGKWPATFSSHKKREPAAPVSSQG